LRASAVAVARPMPRAPPVTATTFPCNERGARATAGTLTDYRAATAKDQEEPLPDVEAHITGTVWKIECQVGQQVEEGDTLVILESMKMEMPVEAEDDGTVKEISCQEGQSVSEGDTLVVLE
jgi:acetyl-CoA carboxylase biotin carboxyl carrier protein